MRKELQVLAKVIAEQSADVQREAHEASIASSAAGMRPIDAVALKHTVHMSTAWIEQVALLEHMSDEALAYLANCITGTDSVTLQQAVEWLDYERAREALGQTSPLRRTSRPVSTVTEMVLDLAKERFGDSYAATLAAINPHLVANISPITRI